MQSNTRILSKLLGLLIGLFIMQAASPHYKAKYHVIADTDGGIDDFRALCMLLASPEIEVIAITTSDGILAPSETAARVSALLDRFGHQGIPVGIGNERESQADLPAGARKTAMKASWGKTTEAIDPEQFPGAVDLILSSLDLEEMPVDILAMGPLTNIAEALQSSPGLENRIRKIICRGMNGEGLNFAMDPQAADQISRSGFSVDIIHSGENKIPSLQDFLQGLDTLGSDYANAVRDLYTQDPALGGHHMGTRISDECIPLYLAEPVYFISDTVQKAPERIVIQPARPSGLLLPLLRVLQGDMEDRCIIFNRFPVDPGLFEEDVAAISDKIIDSYGHKEWKIVVLTNEFHEHLGIYSIIGAKMGLRAREYFNVGIDELLVESYAGNTPPVSCLNDGLQVSTGATLGHGTISVGNEKPSPHARFSFKNTTIELRLKENLRDRIREDVSAGVRKYGLDSPDYWIFIRELALKYWAELDRREIFEITQVM